MRRLYNTNNLMQVNNEQLYHIYLGDELDALK